MAKAAKKASAPEKENRDAALKPKLELLAAAALRHAGPRSGARSARANALRRSFRCVGGGTIEGRRVAFLARHGRGHRFTPSEINYRANLYAMKLLGVERVISVSAVGSLQEELRPARISDSRSVLRSHARRVVSTFFGEGIVAHVGFDQPVCPQVGRRNWRGLRRRGVTSPSRRNVRVHGRAAIFDARRGARAPAIAFRGHRDDERD